MKALLDTHVWLWYLLGDKRLARAHRRIIEDNRSSLWLSSVSVWEAHLLIERERISVSKPAAVWIDEALRALALREAPLTFAIAMRSRTLTLHEDLADRFIAATALEGGMTLLTSDDRLRGCRELPCL